MIQLLLWPVVPIELVQRLAAFGWTLTADGCQWRLDGNGEPAYFGALDGLEDWLSHQERAEARKAAA